jgi:hypothetical protein
MARELTPEGLRAIFSEETDQAFIGLVTITHADLVPPFRAARNREPVVRFAGTENEVTFVPYAFNAVLPEDHKTRPPTLSLTIDNVDRVIVQTLRQLATPPQVELLVVRAAAPDTPELTLPKFRLREAKYNVLSVEGTLTLRNLQNEPWPHQRYTNASHPALFPL